VGAASSSPPQDIVDVAKSLLSAVESTDAQSEEVV